DGIEGAPEEPGPCVGRGTLLPSLQDQGAYLSGPSLLGVQRLMDAQLRRIEGQWGNGPRFGPYAQRLLGKIRQIRPQPLSVFDICHSPLQGGAHFPKNIQHHEPRFCGESSISLAASERSSSSARGPRRLIRTSASLSSACSAGLALRRAASSAEGSL